MIFASGGYMFANIGQRHFFFGHSVDLGMFSRVPATSLQTVASMCAFPCTARRRAQVWAHPVGAGGQQRQIPHMRHSHPGLPRAHALFGGGASAVLFVRRTLTGDISFVVCAPICRSLPPSIPLSLSPLSLSPPTALRSCKTSSICSGSPWRRSCRCAPCLHSVDARVSWGARPLLEGRFFWVTRALPCQACTTPLLAPGLASGRRGSGQWTASTPTGARSTRARIEATRRRRVAGRRYFWPRGFASGSLADGEGDQPYSQHCIYSQD